VLARWMRARPGAPRFVLHLVEMMLAMLAGMGLLAPLWMWLVPDLHERPGLHVMVMAADMAIGMGLWMRIRAHDWRMITEMSVAMVAPFALLLVPYQAGWLSGELLSPLGHGLMLMAMLGVMLVRRDHYSRPQGWAWPWRTRSQAATAPAAADRAR
jgi:uncharacterized membrane protein YfcA